MADITFKAKPIRETIKDTTAFAFVQGFWERLTLGDAFGRTHETNHDWNEAYDSGANLADAIIGGE